MLHLRHIYNITGADDHPDTPSSASTAIHSDFIHQPFDLDWTVVDTAGESRGRDDSDACHQFPEPFVPIPLEISGYQSRGVMSNDGQGTAARSDRDDGNDVQLAIRFLGREESCVVTDSGGALGGGESTVGQ